MYAHPQSIVRKIDKSLSEDDDQFGWNHEYADVHARIVAVNCNYSLRNAFTHASNQDTFKAIVTEAKVQLLPNTSSDTIKSV